VVDLSPTPDLAGLQPASFRRATLIRRWQGYLAEWLLVLLPASAELPFADRLDLKDVPRVEAQMTQGRLPLLGLPWLTVMTGRNGRTLVGLRLVAARHREDVPLATGEAIEAPGAAITPADPRGAA
jgi:amidase